MCIGILLFARSVASLCSIVLLSLFLSAGPAKASLGPITTTSFLVVSWPGVLSLSLFALVLDNALF